MASRLGHELSAWQVLWRPGGGCRVIHPTRTALDRPSSRLCGLDALLSLPSWGTLNTRPIRQLDPTAASLLSRNLDVVCPPRSFLIYVHANSYTVCSDLTPRAFSLCQLCPSYATDWVRQRVTVELGSLLSCVFFFSSPIVTDILFFSCVRVTLAILSYCSLLPDPARTL